MKILAIDTATERCSVALRVDGRTVSRTVETVRGHADLILPLVQEVLAEGAASLRGLDGIAYGRGPGAFTGVRIAIGVVQGLALGADLSTVGVSNLAAVAQQVAGGTDRILVCMDARMNEVYWGVFERGAADGLVRAASMEQVSGPDAVIVDAAVPIAAGTGFRAYPLLAQRFGGSVLRPDVLPHAEQIALLGEASLGAGEGVPARDAQPVYLRNNVAIAKR